MFESLVTFINLFKKQLKVTPVLNQSLASLINTEPAS